MLRDEIVDLRWVVHQSVSESRRLQEQFDARAAELNATRQIASTLAKECEGALEQRRAELSSLAVAAGVEAARRPEVKVVVDTPRGAAALLLRLLLPTSVYVGLRDALGSPRRWRPAGTSTPRAAPR